MSQKKKGPSRRRATRLRPRMPARRPHDLDPQLQLAVPYRAPIASSRFPIVGVGASAGGLEAFKLLLASFPLDLGMGIVLIQHLDPNHESLSVDILSRVTKLPVEEVADRTRVVKNHIYVIPPNFEMEISGGVLKLFPRPEARLPQTTIDLFLRSLAEDARELAVGVVLSGNGSDGTEGLAAIQASGGTTFAQTPASAKFDAMPSSAIAAGCVDRILAPAEIGAAIGQMVRSRSLSPSVREPSAPGGYRQIFALLRNSCHVDFTYYKSNTIQRRTERRMSHLRIAGLAKYVEFLTEHPNELKQLSQDLLIHVTRFFRDADAFRAISGKVFPKIMKARPAGHPIRIWVPGCSTGEEVYSLAILLLEFLGDRVSNTPVQIFASDVSELAIQRARIGEYPECISRDVSPERLNRFFLKTEGGGYKVSKSIRDICLFSRHDITVDPPFAKMDLISCRNLLIYFTPALQKHVIPIFHYATSTHGFLWLGRSETIGHFSKLFSLVDKTNKIYCRRNTPVTLSYQFLASTYVPGKQEALRKPAGLIKKEVDIQKLADLALQAEYPGVLVNEEMEIVQFRGRTAPFVEPVAGAASYHLFKMARPDFVPELKLLLLAARKTNVAVSKEGLSFRDGRRTMFFDLKVIPVKPSSISKERFYFVLFESAHKASRGKGKSSAKGHRTVEDPTRIELQQELILHDEHQRSLIEKYETTQENLTGANEELQSANEELQSTNEELETVKEELQSSNEELTTVNDELQSRSIEQVQLANDLINLLGSVEIPILMLGDDRRIRRFTPLAGKALNLISTDVGRPISDLKLNFTSPGIDLDLDRLVSGVLETLTEVEIEVQDRQRKWFRLQIKPYKTLDHKIDGAVIALVDIDGLKRSLKEVRLARSEAEKANRGKDIFLATLSHELRTPLTSIIAWAHMLRRGTLSEEKAKKGIAIIEESGRAQAQLINDLLDVSRIVSGKLALELHEINPVSVVHSAIEAVRQAAELKSIRIEATFDPNVGTILADPLRLQQVFWNLLTNSIKFSEVGANICVRIERAAVPESEKFQVMIAVRDFGKGINAKFLPQIFDRFSQEDSSSVRLHGGLGLGLAIVRNLVELHGGTVRATSAGDKLGSEFCVFLPMQSPEPLLEPAISLGSAFEGQISLEGIRVLLVDDESNIRETFIEVLALFGAQTHAVASAHEAIEQLSAFEPDVLVSDLGMPGEDGYSLIHTVRGRSPANGGRTPAIALTAYASAGDIKRALAAGFDAHLAKPLEGRRLAETIAKLLGRKSKSGDSR